MPFNADWPRKDNLGDIGSETQGQTKILIYVVNLYHRL